MGADGLGQTNLSRTPGATDTQPAWSPDGGWIAFRSTIFGRDDEILVMGADGAAPTNLTRSPTSDEAVLALGQLQPRHEREQAERRHAVDAAAQELAVAQAQDGAARLAATAQAQARATLTAAAQGWQERDAARLSAHATAVAATAAALPTPAPSQAISPVAGRVARVTAEQHDGRLVVTVEIVAE